MTPQGGKDSAKSVQQARWRMDVREYEKNKVEIERYEKMLKSNYSTTSKVYISKCLDRLRERQKTICSQYPNLKLD